MILIDFSNIFHINLYIANKPDGVDEHLLRHLVLNTIRLSNVKFRETYGRIVIACDGRVSWRKKQFPFYKEHRKAARDKQEMDWTNAFDLFDKIKRELDEYTDYIVIEHDQAEGDDVIATLARRFDNQSNVVVSKDHDFLQLVGYTFAKIYDPTLHMFLDVDDPFDYLNIHIIKGDRGDGIPNVLSNSNVFVDKERQTRLTKKKIQELNETPVDSWPEIDYAKNWARNRTLIDLRMTPERIQTDIIQMYYDQKDKTGKKLYQYFYKHKLMKLLEQRNDFN